MANKKLGIHLAPGALKLVEVEQQAKKNKVLSSSIDYFPLQSALETEIKKQKPRTKDAFIVLSGADTVYKLIELPEMAEKDIASAIRYKLKSLLPASFKDFIMDYYKIEKEVHKGKHFYFVAAVPQDKILNIIETIKTAGLSLKDIVAPSCALRNVLGVSPLEPAALIYLGKDSSLVVLVKQGQVVFAREVLVGGDDITQAMVGEVMAEEGKLEFDYQKAEEIKNKYGIPLDPSQYLSEAGVPAAEVLALMRPALEKISSEILNTFDYYRQEIGDETEFKKIYFTGGTSKTKNLLSYLKEPLGLELLPLPVDIDPTLSLALGATVSGRDHLSFIPKKGGELLLGNISGVLIKEIRKRSKIIFSGFLCLLVLVLVFGWFSLQQKELNATRQSLQKKYQEYMVKSGKEAEAQKGIAELIKYGLRDRFTLVMHELEKTSPKDVYFTNIVYENNASQLTIKGLVLASGGKRSMAKFVENLGWSKYFKSTDLIYMEESNAYSVATYDFELKCLLAGGR